MIEKFAEIYQNRYQYAKDWRARTGGKVLGYFYPDFPEEIVYAAGVLPVRILGSHKMQDITKPYIYRPLYCPLAHDCLDQGLEGGYDYLDGIVSGDTCMHMNQVFDCFVLYCGVSRNDAFIACNAANYQSRHVRAYLAKQYLEFKKSLEKWTGKAITDEDLDRGIEIMNRNRRLMRQVYEMRKMDKPPITGAEAMSMVLASQVSDKEEHSQIVEQVLKKELPGRNSRRETGVRLMSLGSEDDDTAFLKMVENMGATFVIDETWLGSRYFWNDVVPDEDRLSAIANRQVDSPRFPTRDWDKRLRLSHILKLVQDYGVQKVFHLYQKSCHPYELDLPSVQAFLNKHGIPMISLEFDTTIPVESFKGAVKAFL